MKLVDVPYNEKLENTKSKEFENLAVNLEAIVSLTPQGHGSPTLAPFCIVYCGLFQAEYYTHFPFLTED